MLTTPIIRCLKLQSKAEIHYLTFMKNKNVIEQNIYIDKLITIEQSLHEVRAHLAQEKYDLVIDLHKNIRSIILTTLLPFKSVSYDKLSYQKWLMVNFKINRLPPSKHLVDRYFEAIKPFGIENDQQGLDFFVHSEQLPELPKKYIVVVLGAAHATKRISPTLAQKIINNSKLPVVLIGGVDVIDQAYRLTVQESLNLIGKLSINQSAMVIQKSNYVITGDTGMMHIAAALKKEIILLWASTFKDFGMYPYYGNDNPVVYHDMMVKDLDCMPCTKIGRSQCPKGHHHCMELQDEEKIVAIINN